MAINFVQIKCWKFPLRCNSTTDIMIEMLYCNIIHSFLRIIKYENYNYLHTSQYLMIVRWKVKY